MRYRLRFSSKADKYLGRLDRRTQERIRERLDELALNPDHGGTKLLHGGSGLRTMRVGDFRVVYSVVDRDLLVFIERIAPRGQVYRDL